MRLAFAMPMTDLRGCSVVRQLGSLLENKEARPQRQISPLVDKLNDPGPKYRNQLALKTMKLNISNAFVSASTLAGASVQ